MATGIRFDGTQFGWADNYIATDPGAFRCQLASESLAGFVAIAVIYPRFLTLLIRVSPLGIVPLIGWRSAS